MSWNSSEITKDFFGILTVLESRRFGRDPRACAVLDQKVGACGPRVTNAATHVLCGLMLCHVVYVVAVMLLHLTVSVRKRVTGKFREKVTSNFWLVTGGSGEGTCNLVGVGPLILGVWPLNLGL